MIPSFKRNTLLFFVAFLIIFLTTAVAEDDIAPVELVVDLAQKFDKATVKAISPDGTKMLIEDWEKRGWPLCLVEIGTW